MMRLASRMFTLRKISVRNKVVFDIQIFCKIYWFIKLTVATVCI